MQFRPGRPDEAKPLIGIYAESGRGKTYSALLLARGFVGPEGRIGMIETETGRGEAYADPVEYPEIGGYDVAPLRDDFSPQRYGEAIAAAEKARLNALIIDSASHEWEGVGGVLSLADKQKHDGRSGPLVWTEPKRQHYLHFMTRFMQTPIPLVILCMRAKYPMKERTKPGGGKEWVRSTELEPKQADDILFEMFVHGWIDEQHCFHLTKCTSRKLEPVFNQVKPITLETGKQLAAWAERSKSPAPTSSATGRNDPTEDELMTAGEENAVYGNAALKTWWQSLRDDQRELLGPGKSGCPQELKDIAKEAEKRAAGQ